jgi:hypothetical protein
LFQGAKIALILSLSKDECALPPGPAR